MVNYKIALGAGMSLAGTLVFMSNADASVYTVKSGDTLNNIAKAHNTTLDYILANNSQFVANPDLIFPDQEVYFPDNVDNTQTTTTYQDEASNASEATTGTGTDNTQADTSSSFNNNEQVTASSSSAQGSQSDAEYAASRMSSATGVSYDTWYKIIMRESGGNAQAVNPSSGAYGILQLYGHGEYVGMSLDAQIEMAINLYNNGGLAHWAQTAY